MCLSLSGDSTGPSVKAHMQTHSLPLIRSPPHGCHGRRASVALSLGAHLERRAGAGGGRALVPRMCAACVRVGASGERAGSLLVLRSRASGWCYARPRLPRVPASRVGVHGEGGGRCGGVLRTRDVRGEQNGASLELRRCGRRRAPGGAPCSAERERVCGRERTKDLGKERTRPENEGAASRLVSKKRR